MPRTSTGIGVFLLVLGAYGVAAADTRPPAVEGQFYPASPSELRHMVDDFLSNAGKPEITGQIVALLSPHAGYVFSGQVAAYAYKELRGRHFDTVIIIGPCHHVYLDRASVGNWAYYETPLGKVKVNQGMVKRLMRRDKIVFRPEAHLREHAVEVQLPFLQQVLGEVQIVPMVIGEASEETCREISDALVQAIGHENVLLVASSDMSHFPSYEEARRVDRETLNALETFDPSRVLQSSAALLREGIPRLSCTLCGLQATTVVMMTAKRLGADQVNVLHYANSGDVSVGGRASKNRVVGYGAGVFYKSKEEEKNMGRIEQEPLDEVAQQELLRIARQSIESYVTTGQIPSLESTIEMLKDQRGVFVTLTEHGQLRGCIGHHESDVPLYKLVPRMAVAAACEDPRFYPLRKEELDQVKIKVSVYLTNVYQIKNLDEFEMGVHGIILVKGGRGATYLPEVPTEAGWTSKEEEMEHLCAKAGLPPGAWRKGAEFYVYRTQVFGEE